MVLLQKNRLSLYLWCPHVLQSHGFDAATFSEENVYRTIHSACSVTRSCVSQPSHIAQEERKLDRDVFFSVLFWVCRVVKAEEKLTKQKWDGGFQETFINTHFWSNLTSSVEYCVRREILKSIMIWSALKKKTALKYSGCCELYLSLFLLVFLNRTLNSNIISISSWPTGKVVRDKSDECDMSVLTEVPLQNRKHGSNQEPHFHIPLFKDRSITWSISVGLSYNIT